MKVDLVQRFEAIRIFGQNGKLAPHKPLLLLFALAKLKSGGEEYVTFPEAEEVVGPLIQTYGPFNAKTTVAYPFARLANDRSEIWQVEDHQKTASGDIKVRDARERHIKAGFTPHVLTQFKKDQKLIDIVAINLLERHFPPSLHSDILEAVGLQLGINDIFSIKETYYKTDDKYNQPYSTNP